MDGDGRHEIYMECLRNHAASLGSYATDGCGEFTLDDTSPGGLHCAACGCHRNFHRKVGGVGCAASIGDGGFSTRGGGVLSCRSGRDAADVMELVEYGAGCISGGGGRQQVGSPDSERSGGGGVVAGGKKRFRTKFTAEQKGKMLGFAEKLGWKLQRKDQEEEIDKFCKGVGVSRQVFKVWMHNHKNTNSSAASNGNASSLTQ